MGSKNRLLVALLVFLGFFSALVVWVFQETIFSRSDDSALIGKAVPQLMLFGLPNGSLISSGDFEGARNESLREIVQRYSSKGENTLVILWATWCAPCERELEGLVHASELLKKNKISVILVNYDEGIPERLFPEMKAWLISRGLGNFVNYFDFKQELFKELGVHALPYSFGIDTSDKIKWVRLGELKWNTVASLFNGAD